MNKLKKAAPAYKVGDVIELFDEKGNYEVITYVDKRNVTYGFYLQTEKDSYSKRDLEDVKLVAQAGFKPGYVLKYDLDQDPIEFYETLTQVKNRLVYLKRNKTWNGFKPKSVKVYKIQREVKVKI